MPRHDPPADRLPDPPPRRASPDDPDRAAVAWRRFRRILGWMGLVSAAVAVAAWGWMELVYGPLGWVARAAIVAGVFCTMLLATALMGLVFASAATGHDERAGRD